MCWVYQMKIFYSILSHVITAYYYCLKPMHQADNFCTNTDLFSNNNN